MTIRRREFIVVLGAVAVGRPFAASAQQATNPVIGYLHLGSPQPYAPLVAAFLSTLRARGHEPRLLRKTGTADFNLFARRHPGTPILAYGPGDPALDHTPEERLALADYHEAVATLDQVFHVLGRTPQRALSLAPAAVSSSPAPS